MGKFLTLVGLLTQAIITSMTVTDANRQTFAIVLILVAWMALIYIVRQYLWRQDQDEATRCSIQFIGRIGAATDNPSSGVDPDAAVGYWLDFVFGRHRCGLY